MGVLVALFPACLPRGSTLPRTSALPPGDAVPPPSDPLPFRIAVLPPEISGADPAAGLRELVDILRRTPPVFANVVPAPRAVELRESAAAARAEGLDFLLLFSVGAPEPPPDDTTSRPPPARPVRIDVVSARSGRFVYGTTLRRPEGLLRPGAPLASVGAELRRTLAVGFRAAARTGNFAENDAATLALIVGAGRFAAADRIPALPRVAADAAAFRDWLLAPEGGGAQAADVKVLLDYEATRPAIEDAVRTHLRARARPHDRIVVWLGGGGLLVPSADPAAAPEPWLLTADANPRRPRETALPLAPGPWYGLEAAAVCLVVDAGFHGVLEDERVRWAPEGTARVPDGVLELTWSGVPGRAALFAARPGEPTADQPAHAGGAFLWALRRALGGAGAPRPLADADADGRVTARELAAFLPPLVADAAAIQGLRQRPVWIGDTDARRDWLGRSGAVGRRQ